jgi:hypothetical protein
MPRKPRRTKAGASRLTSGRIVDVIAGVPVVDETPMGAEVDDVDFVDDTKEGRTIIFVGWQPGGTIVEQTEEVPGVTLHHVRPIDEPPPKRKAKRPAAKRPRRS